MARPSKFDREEALQTVMNTIWREGYEASSVKSLSELLGITRSSFYNAFGTREDLFREVMTLYAGQSPDAVLGEVGPEIRVRPFITLLFKTICKARAGDPEGRGCLLINTVTELCPAKEGLGVTLAEAVLCSSERLEHVVRHAVDSGELPADTDVHATALALQTLMIGLNVLCKVVRDEAELWASAAATLKGLDLYEETSDA